MGDDEDKVVEESSDSSSSGDSGDSTTETSEQGFGSRLKDSIASVGIGLLLFIAAFPLLWKNEGCAVASYKGLTEGKGKVISVDASKIDPSNNSKLIHLTGQAATDETLKDNDFGISIKAISLNRKAEMYQWEEKVTEKKEKKVGGKEVTTKTTSYSKVWAAKVIDSSAFKKKQGHENPGVMEFADKKISSKDVKVGAYPLPDELIAKITGSEPLAFEAEQMQAIPAALKLKVKKTEGGLFIGADPSKPQVGDLKIKFEFVKPQPVSIIAQQLNNTLTSYVPEKGEKILMLQSGTVAADSMFKQAAEDVGMRTWILRLVGFIMMGAGLSMVFKPISTLLDVVPFLGSIASFGFGLVSFIVALVLSLVTIAIAWIVARPIVAVILLLAGAGAFFGFRYYGQQKKAKAA